MYIVDTRKEANGSIYRRYHCSNNLCGLRVSSLEEFVDVSRKEAFKSETIRLKRLQASVLELLEEVATTRGNLNEIERKLLEAFNKGVPSDNEGEGQPVVGKEPLDPYDINTSVRLLKPTKRPITGGRY